MKKKTLGGGLESVDLASKKRRGVFKISVFITSIFVIFLSVTYALVGQVLTGGKRQVVTAGDIRIRLDEENEITLNNAMPVYDEVGMIGTPFKFQVVNEGSSKANYILKLIDITTGEESTKLSPSLVRYGLTKDGETTIKSLSSAFSGFIDKGSISGNQTIEYELRLWINFNVEDESLIKDKTIKYKIGIEVEQPKQFAKYDSMMTNAGYNETKMFWKYKKQVTSIAFEPAINIPSGAENWDVSSIANPGQVMAYVEELGETVTVNSETLPAYKLHIQAKNGVAANTYSSFLFKDFTNLTIIDGLEYLDTSKVTNMSQMFYECRSLTSLDVSNFDTSKVTNMTMMFAYCNKLANLDVTNFDTSNVIEINGLFYYCSNLTHLDVSDFDTSNVTRISQMFSGCESLISLNLSNFNTSKVTDMSSMFSSCTSLVSLDLSNFNTSSVTTMRGMFSNCSSLATLDVSNFETANVTDMYSMFSRCSSLTSIDLSNFDTSNVTDMSSMFIQCDSLVTLDLSKFNTSSVTNMKQMFWHCDKLSAVDISGFDISNVTDMYSMFGYSNYPSPNIMIIVKDEATKTWVLGIRSDLTNVQVKGA